MSYLRPLNSSEGNLYVIRFTTPELIDADVTTVDGSYRLADTSKYDAPSIDLLPAGFKYLVGDTTTKSYKIHFGTMTNPYVNAPSVNITMLRSTNTQPTDIDKYEVIIDEIATTHVIFSLRVKEDTDVANSTVAPIDTGVLLLVRFSVIIIGSVVSGATFAISNRGWSVPESSTSKLYTYQSVGVGTGKVDGNLNVKGTLVQPAYIAVLTNGSNMTTLATAIRANTISILTPTAVTTALTVTLGTGYDGQVVEISSSGIAGSGGTLELAAGSMFGGVALSVATNTTYYYSKLYYDATVGVAKWRVLAHHAIV
jgi:hypothetical protein